MADEWIKMRHSLRDDPAVFVIAEQTGLDELGVVGRLYAVWEWFDRHTEDGVAGGASFAWVDRIAAHDGFAAAMQSAGWLDEPDAGGVALPGFGRHNGASAKRRAKDNARKGRGTAAEEPRNNRGKNAEQPRKERGKPVDETRNREEEIREEEIREEPIPRHAPHEYADPEIGEAASAAGGVAAEEFQARLGLTRTNTEHACRRIGREAAELSIDGHDPPDVVRAAFARLASKPNAPAGGIGHWKNAVIAEIREAHENQQLPRLWVERTNDKPKRVAVEGW